MRTRLVLVLCCGRRPLLGAAAALLILGASATHAVHHAHAAGFVSSNPPDQAMLTAVPAQIVLTFDSRIRGAPSSMLHVMVGNDSALAGVPVLDADTGTTLTASLLQGFGSGTYSISWKVTDSVDGSITTGSLSFTVAVNTPSSGASATVTTVVSSDGLTTGVTVTLQHGQPNATYTVCLTDPVTQQFIDACNPAAASLGGVLVSTPSVGPAPSTPADTLLTDAAGSGHDTVSTGAAPIIWVVIWNNADPGDVIQIVVNTNAAGTPDPALSS